MIIDIFIRTYKRDFPLVKCTVYSILKYVTSFRSIIITVRNKEYIHLINTFKIEPFFITNQDKIKIISVPDFNDNMDYFGQQITKLHADIYTNAEYIMFLDSDCVFNDNFDIKKEMFDQDEKVILLVEKWENLPKMYDVWKTFLQVCDFKTEFEFMRRVPLLYPSKIFKNLRDYFAAKYKIKFTDFCLQIYNSTDTYLPHKYFSEFNLLGAYSYIYEPNYFNFINQSDVSSIPLKQVQHYDFDYNVNKQLQEMKKILKIV
jgi:hypothetical protein